MSTGDYEFEKLRAIFEGDGSEVRRQFILAGLILAIYERFKRFAKDQVNGFFSNRINFKEDGTLHIVPGKEFIDLMKEVAKRPGGKNNDQFRAALLWFHRMGAIDQGEHDEVERLYQLRNEIGHELAAIVADDRKAPITFHDVAFALGIYVRIGRWWIKEIEAAIDPTMNSERFQNTDWDSAEPLDTALLRMIMEKALSGDSAWEEFQEEVRKYSKLREPERAEDQ